jgi:hypothetical protein
MKPTYPLAFCLSFALMLVAMLAPAPAGAASCSLTYTLPGDVAFPTSQAAVDLLSWQTFLALNAPAVGGQVSTTGDNSTQWSAWSSTSDLLDQGPEPGPSGSGYYPAECQGISNYQNYRVIDEVGKVDDNFEEATQQGLSTDPVIAGNSTSSLASFVRYEILLSPATYNFVVGNLYNRYGTLANLGSPVVFPCGQLSYTGGDPAVSQLGGLLLKLAWMPTTGIDTSQFHTENLLIYNPSYRTTTGQASCQLQQMALVGMHILHKTQSQQAWIWSTFEHELNAPDCAGTPPPGNQNGGGSSGNTTPNTACPASVSQNYNFYPQTCNNGNAACAACNTVPTSNAPSPTDCLNPNDSRDVGWCLNQGPKATGGISKLCRQLAVATYYPSANAQNQACASALTASSVWSNYQLISTQWITATSVPPSCGNISSQIYSASGGTVTGKGIINPQITLTNGTTSTADPYLGNTSMESYERTSCMSCHAKSVVDENETGSSTNVSTDFVYFLGVEVPNAPGSSFQYTCTGSSFNSSTATLTATCNNRYGFPTAASLTLLGISYSNGQLIQQGSAASSYQSSCPSLSLQILPEMVNGSNVNLTGTCSGSAATLALNGISNENGVLYQGTQN